MGTGSQTTADEIRAFIRLQYFGPTRARRDLTVKIRSGDVHRDMGLVSWMPSVCSVLDSKKSHESCGAKLVNRQTALLTQC